jgi:alkanesulfonate monooxygenase SsuD/methylene tetrahydromethanopterin reductase-like flavin-dependent oxidoreductase (luciferase family)
MHVGLVVIFQSLEKDRSDADIWRSQLGFAGQAEDRGFDSVWTAEHHFSDYVMSPNPAQFLTWIAARTSRIALGSAVVVIPWHDPVRLTEELAVLDNISEHRLVVGFGRGLGPTEFAGFRVEMGESRVRFVEHAEAIMQGLETGAIEYDGELYKQPRVDIRPRPAASFAGRVYASAVSPQSAEIMARLGFGLMIIAQKPWETTIAEISEYRKLYEEINGAEPPRPLLVNFTGVHEDPEQARELVHNYGRAYARSAVAHYDFTNPLLEKVNGYEYYANLRMSIEKRGLETFARFLAELQISGTPEEVTELTIERVRLIDAGAVINVFSFGGMPDEVAQHSIDLYTEKVLPKLKEFDPFRDVGRASAAAGAR